jgi:hypothetical protein
MSALPATTCLAVLVCLLATRPASADDVTWKPGERVTSRVRGEIVASDRVHEHDGVYGRFDGDLTLTLGLGVELDGSARGAALGRALYYHSAGIVLGYSDALGADGADLNRIGFVGIELRPLFLPRWALDLEFNTPTLDLALDSLALGVSLFRAGRDAEAGGAKSGLELSLGFGVPLCGRAQGLWLEARGFLRPGLGDEAQGALFGLSYYGTLLTPLVD